MRQTRACASASVEGYAASSVARICAKSSSSRALSIVLEKAYAQCARSRASSSASERFSSALSCSNTTSTSGSTRRSGKHCVFAFACAQLSPARCPNAPQRAESMLQ